MSSPGINVDRGIRILRLSLWAGAVVDASATLWMGLALLVAAHPAPLPFYSAALAVALATLAAVRLVAAYAPYGNRRLIRVLAAAGIAFVGVCWWLGRGSAPLTAAAVSHAVLALGLLLGLKLARL